MDVPTEEGNKSVFSARPELDPFFLYGLAERNYGLEDDDDDALQAIAESPSDLIRMKLARLEERRRFFGRGSIGAGKEEPDAEKSSEESEEEEKINVAASKPSAMSKSKPNSSSSTMKKLVPSCQDTNEKISHSLTQISGTFSQIFQAFLVLMEEAHMAEVSRFSPAEKEKVNKRAKEFEIRLKRSTFELKQKVCRTSTIIFNFRFVHLL